METRKEDSFYKRENKALLTELHHRLRNTLAVISGLIDLELDEAKNNKDPLESLYQIRKRVLSLSQVYNALYNMDALHSIDLVNVIEQIYSITKQHDEGADIHIIDQIIDKNKENFLSIDLCLPLGLLINEYFILISKYHEALGEQSKVIVKIQIDTNYINLNTSFKNILLPKFHLLKKSEKLSLLLMQKLTQQLDAEKSDIDKHWNFSLKIPNASTSR